tara:strand:- start:51 stop:713 length:663 start_codon:yes stop_codon:yes gene_type:complete
MLFLYLLISFVLAQEPQQQEVPTGSETIIVEAHKDFEVYVAPPVVSIQSTEVEAVLAEKTIFTYAARHARQAKVRNERNTAWEIVTLNHKIKVYDEDTIEFVWDNCDYKREAKKCAYQNNHMLQETLITVDDHQIVVNMILYDSDLTVIGTSVYTTDSEINWIKQQEVTMVTQQGMLGNSTMVNMPKEELPLKWLIPANLLDKQISQASALLWIGVRLTQ